MVAVLLAEHRRARPCGVDVVPQAVRLGDLGDAGDRVDGAGARGADRARHDRRMQAGGEVLLDRGAQRVRAQGEDVVDLEQAHVREARDARAPLDRRVRLRGPVGDQAVDRRAGPRRLLARDHVDEVRGVRRAHLDHAAARADRRLEVLREPEQVDEPVEDVRLDLRQRRAGGPDHALRAQPGRHQLGEDRRARRVGREVGEPARGLPVRDARQDDLVQVAQQRRERLGLLRRGRAAAWPRISPGSTLGAIGSSPTRSM